MVRKTVISGVLVLFIVLLRWVFQVVKMKCSGKVFALKVLNKWEMLKRHQVSALPRGLTFPKMATYIHVHTVL